MTVGVGLHVGAEGVRAAVVEVSAGGAAEVVAEAVAATLGDDGPEAALANVAASLPTGVGAATVVAWAAGPVAVTDVGGWAPATLDALFRRRAAAGDDTVTVTSVNGRRVALTLAWDAAGADALAASARRAGFDVLAIEPAALSALRGGRGREDGPSGIAVGAAVAAALRTPAELRAIRPHGPAERRWVVERLPGPPGPASPRSSRRRRLLGRWSGRRDGPARPAR